MTRALGRMRLDVTGQSFIFRPMSETDVAGLHDWLQAGRTSRSGGPATTFATLTATREKYLPRIDDDSPIKGYIALLDGAPIGFIQSYVALGCGDGWWEGERDPGVRGIDQFLGDGDSLGKGLGTRLVAAFVRKLFEDPDVTRVQTDPAPDNVRAIRCYEKLDSARSGRSSRRTVPRFTWSPSGRAQRTAVRCAARGTNARRRAAEASIRPAGARR